MIFVSQWVLLYAKTHIQTSKQRLVCFWMYADFWPPLQLWDSAGTRPYMQTCHWSHMHGINKDTNKAGVYHNLMIKLIYEVIRMHSAKIWSIFLEKLNGCAFNLAAFLGDIKLLWIMEASVFSNMMAEFERNSCLKIHFTNNKSQMHRGYKTLWILITAVVAEQWHPAWTKRPKCSPPSQYRLMRCRQTQKKLWATLPWGPTVL